MYFIEGKRSGRRQVRSGSLLNPSPCNTCPRVPNRCPRINPCPAKASPPASAKPKPRDLPTALTTAKNDRPASAKPAQYDRPFRKAPTRLWLGIRPVPASTRLALALRSTQAPNRRKASANFCQHEQCDRSIPQAIAKLALSDGECDRA